MEYIWDKTGAGDCLAVVFGMGILFGLIRLAAAMFGGDSYIKTTTPHEMTEEEKRFLSREVLYLDEYGMPVYEEPYRKVPEKRITDNRRRLPVDPDVIEGEVIDDIPRLPDGKRKRR